MIFHRISSLLSFIFLSVFSSALLSQSVDTFFYTGAKEIFIPPFEFTQITMTVFGADGGNYTLNDTVRAYAGSGAVARATFVFTPDDTLEIVVGEAGESLIRGGGGGGSGVKLLTAPDNLPLIVAGGGGGASSRAEDPNKDQQGGRAESTGGNFEIFGPGGENGYGGGAGKDTSNQTNDFIGGAGGGGVNGPGENGAWTRTCLRGMNMATRTTYGGTGGFCAPRSQPEDCVIICECGNYVNTANGYGGFGVGGGGAANLRGSGGGGGYSGGAGGIEIFDFDYESGGGSSYIDMAGYNPSIIAGISCGANRGHGLIIFEYQATTSLAVVPTLGEWGLIILFLSILIIGSLALVKKSFESSDVC